MLRKALFPSLFVGAALIVGCESSSDNPSDRPHNDNRSMDMQHERMAANASHLDSRTFVMKAASGGMYEVQSSQLALNRNVDGQLKAFAQRMVDDHTKANNQLKALAQKKGISVPDQMLPQQLDLYNQLQGAQGSDFSRLYREQQMQAHDQTIQLFQDARDQLSDSDLRNFAAETLPTLKEHRQMLMPGEHLNH